MGPQVIVRSNNRFSVLDEHGVILEDVSKEAVEEYFVTEFKRRFWLLCKPITLTHEEYKTAAGKIACCDCGDRVTVYNKNWKEANQRCEKCKTM